VKTKFSPILKVRKLDVERVESEIVKLQNQKRVAKRELESLYQTLYEQKTPNIGSVIELQKSYEIIQILKKDINLKKQNIQFLDEQIKLTQELLKKAMLEYEKIKHLHELEEKSMLEKIKKLEEKNMDEIAIQLFSREKTL